MIAPFTPLPITHPARAWVHSTHQTPELLAETFARHTPILVCPVEQNTACILPAID